MKSKNKKKHDEDVYDGKDDEDIEGNTSLKTSACAPVCLSEHLLPEGLPFDIVMIMMVMMIIITMHS